MMLSGDAAKYLWDAMRAAERISRFTEGRDYHEYLADEMLRSAVERQFEIIGGALAGLRRVSPELAAMIPDLRHIVAVRNVLIHGHATVDDRLGWAVVEGKLREVLAALIGLLDRAEARNWHAPKRPGDEPAGA